VTSARPGWIATPRCDSRTGASHLRRGAPCQDASGLWLFRDAAGDPIQVLVVSDGHGGSRYVRSDVGSRLACEVALRTVERTLRSSRTAQAGREAEWRQWLAEALPQAIVEAWLEEVKRHWQAQAPGLASASEPAPEPASTAAFSPIPYGATLGLLVLTPSWWGHTGLGDWDLVRIEASGEGRLISEEPEAEGGGEATYSLCMRGAARHFAPRSGLRSLSPQEPPFSLLLSTDGIRKSCGTDADYLTLAHYLTELPQNDGEAAGASEFAAALDHISGQGSGDDVSVAIGRWGDIGPQRGRAKRGGWGEPLIVQPPPPPPPAAAVPSDGAAGQLDATSQREPGAVAPDAAEPSPLGPGSSSRRRSPRLGRRYPARLPLRSVLTGAGLLALVAGGGLLLARWQGWGPFAVGEPALPQLTSLQRQQLQRQVDDLCGQVSEATAASDAAEARGSEAASSIPASPAGEKTAGASDPLQAVQPAQQGDSPQGLAGHGSAAALEANANSPHGAQPSAQRSKGQPSTGQPSQRQLSKGNPPQGAGTGGDAGPHPAPTETPGPDRAAALVRIRGTLSNRRSTFRQILMAGDPEVQALLQASAADPLGALIAWSRLQPSLAAGQPGEGPSGEGRSGVEPSGVAGAEGAGGGLRELRWPWMPPNPRGEGASAVPPLTLCPALRLALKAQWALSGAEGHRPAPGAAGSLPAATGSPGLGPAGPAGTGASPAASAPAQGRPSGSGLPPRTPQPGPLQGSGGQDSSDPNRSSR